MARVYFDIDELKLDGDQKIHIAIGGPDSWTTLVVYGDGDVELTEQGKVMLSVNLLHLYRKYGSGGTNQ